MVLYGNTVKKLENVRNDVLFLLIWGGFSSAGLSHTRSLECLLPVFDSLLVSGADRLLPAHILQHIRYLLSSTAMDVLLRFSVATGVPGFAAHAHIAVGRWAGCWHHWAAPRLRARGTAACLERVNCTKKEREERGNILLQVHEIAFPHIICKHIFRGFWRSLLFPRPTSLLAILRC